MIGRVLQGNFAPSDSAPPKGGRSDSLRLVSWNIERGRHANAIGQFVTSLSADVCVFQEVDFNAKRTGKARVAEEIARAVKHNYAFAAAFRELTQGEDAFHGQAIFSRREILRPRIIRFRYQSNFWKPRWWVPGAFQVKGGRTGRRGRVPGAMRQARLRKASTSCWTWSIS